MDKGSAAIKSVAFCYLDLDKKKSLQKKLQWMVQAYINRFVVPPKIAFIPSSEIDKINGEEPVEIIEGDKYLQKGNYVLCQKRSDYLGESRLRK